MLGSRKAALEIAAVLAMTGCEPATPLSWLGIPSIRELPVERAVDRLNEDAGHVVQLRDPGERLGRIPDARLLGRDEDIPPGLAEEPGWLLVVASRPDEAMRLAARLARAGHPRVAVVTGDVGALRDLRTASRQEAATLQPSGVERHQTRSRSKTTN